MTDAQSCGFHVFDIRPIVGFTMILQGPSWNWTLEVADAICVPTQKKREPGDQYHLGPHRASPVGRQRRQDCPTLSRRPEVTPSSGLAGAPGLPGSS
jgi:hypothetical protein